MTRRRRPRNAAESYRNTRRSMGDGTMSGRSRIATPHDTTKLRRATSIVPSGHEPIGETVTVESVARDGNDLIWTKHPGPVAAGRPQAFPTTALVTRTGGYYVLHLEKLDLVSLGGATVTVTTSSGLVRVAAAPSFGRHLRGCEVPLGTLPRGTTVTVSCDQPIVLAVATLEFKDIGAFVFSEPVADIPQNELLAWYRADDLDLADGAGVTFWIDRTGNGYDLNSAAASPPLFRPAGLNGSPSVEFGTGRSITMDPGTFDPHWHVSAIYLVFSLDTSSGSEVILGRQGGAGQDWVLIWAHSPSGFSGSLVGNTGFFNVANCWTSGPQLGAALWTGSTSPPPTAAGELWRDGVLQGSGDSGDRNVNTVRFGGYQTDILQPFKGKLSEVIYYGVRSGLGLTPTPHDTATRQAIETILNARWGL